MKERKEVIEDEFIEIESQRFSIDWTYSKKNKVLLKDIVGIEIDYRIEQSWHIIVVTKERIKDKFYRYELDHWVYPTEVVKLLSEKKVKILNISNIQQCSDFTKSLLFIFKQLIKPTST